MQSNDNKFSWKVFLNLFRSLFPNWNFFDQIGFSFELYYKEDRSNNWVQINFIQNLNFAKQLFINPISNLTLSHYNLIEHFSHELQETKTDTIENLTTFKLLKSFLDYKISETNPEIKNYQFKIVAKNNIDSFEHYISKTLPLVNT